MLSWRQSLDMAPWGCQAQRPSHSRLPAGQDAGWWAPGLRSCWLRLQTQLSSRADSCPEPGLTGQGLVLSPGVGAALAAPSPGPSAASSCTATQPCQAVAGSG
ncbi:unnamed protein product [Lepidochelys kempii]